MDEIDRQRQFEDQFLAQLKAYADGEFLPFQSKQVARLNAPFVANWNDYPSSMDPVLAAAGWQARFTGIFASANISVLLAHLLAGLSFWWVGTRQGYRPGLVFAGSVLFACTHFIFQRNLTHLNLSYYWHVPLMLLVSWWAVTRASTMGKSDEWKAVAICFVAGTFDPYYTVMFLQLLGFAVLFHAVRGQWREARVALFFAFIASIGLLAVNLDTLMYRLVHGPNAAAATRHLVALEAYGMRLPDLFMAPGHHRWQALSEFWRVRYFEPIFESQSAYRRPSFEASSAYIGAAAAIGFLWLAGLSFYQLLRGKLRATPLQAFQLVWILFFSLAGGVNLLLGVFGFQLLRATNRFSVFVVAISLLFLVERLSRLTPRRLVAPAALGLLALGLWDQLPPRQAPEFTDAVARSVASDRDFVGELEAGLPAGSMVFQLPVMDWPESPSAHRVFQNEQMKPYIHSEGLRFSHGSNGHNHSGMWITPEHERHGHGRRHARSQEAEEPRAPAPAPDRQERAQDRPPGQRRPQGRGRAQAPPAAPAPPAWAGRRRKPHPAGDRLGPPAGRRLRRRVPARPPCARRRRPAPRSDPRPRRRHHRAHGHEARIPADDRRARPP